MIKLEQTANRQIARAASVVMVAFILSNLTGLVRQVLVTNAFGTQSEIEAFNAANRVSESLFNLVAGGALASAFIPILTSLLSTNKQQRAWKLVSSIANLVLLTTVTAAVLVGIFAPWVVRHLLAPGFAGDTAKELLTISLMRIMLPSAVIFGLSGLVMGALNSHQVFFFPSLAPAMYQLGMIFGVVFLSPSLGIFGLAWGVVIGAALHLGLQIPALLRLGGKYSLTFGLKSADVQDVVRLMGPRLLGVAVVQLNFWINTRLASQFIEGSVTGIVLGFTLMLMPQAAIAQSIAIAALPTFSAQIARGQLGEMRHSLAASLRGALLLSIPASFGLIILREPIIQSLYQRGQFDDASTQLVSWALMWYSAGLVGHALVEILSRSFYALHDTKTPVFIGILAMSLNVVFSYVFSALFMRAGWMAHGGLALANSVATGIEAVWLLILMRRRLEGIEARFIIEGTLKALIAALIMGGLLIVWQAETGLFSPWLKATGGVILGIMSFVLLMVILRVDEIQRAVRFLRRRLTK